MPENIPVKRNLENTVQLIVFHVADEEFSVRIGDIREIIRTGPITPIPDAPAFVKGLINVRGEIVATIDLKARFSLTHRHAKGQRPEGQGPEGQEESPSKHVIVTEQGGTLFGLMVDEVTEVLRIPEADIKKAPELVTHLHRQYVSGVVALENRLIILIDLARVLSEEELERLMEVKGEDMKVNSAVEVEQKSEAPL